MNDVLARKLGIYTDLDDGDRTALRGLYHSPQSFAAGADVIREGDRPETVCLLLQGWGMRYKSRPDGTRQILAYLVPGDLCDHHVFILEAMDHSIGLLTDATVARIAKPAMLNVMQSRPNVARALWWSSLVDQGILREWLFNVGSRSAFQGVAHLFCEMSSRLALVGLADGSSLTLPISQVELAETIGITPVHVNRVLRQMQDRGLLSLAHKRMTVENLPELQAIAEFDPSYLHLNRRHD